MAAVNNFPDNVPNWALVVALVLFFAGQIIIANI